MGSNGEFAITHTFFSFLFFKYPTVKLKRWNIQGLQRSVTPDAQLQLLGFQRRAPGLGGLSRPELMRTDSPESPA